MKRYKWKISYDRIENVYRVSYNEKVKFLIMEVNSKFYTQKLKDEIKPVRTYKETFNNIHSAFLFCQTKKVWQIKINF